MEKNKSIVRILAGTLLTGAVLYYYQGLFKLSISNLPLLNPYQFENINLAQPHAIANLLHNTYHNWSFDPLLNGLLELCNDYSLVLLYSLFFFLLGCLLLFRDILKDLGQAEQYFYSLVLSILFTTMILRLGGYDLVLVSSLTWVPYFILACRLFFEKRFGSLPMLILFAGLLIVSANQLAPLYLCLIFLLNYKKEDALRNQYYQVIIFLIIAASIYYSLSFALPNFPNYPGNARVLAGDAIPGIVRPLFFSATPIEFLDLQIGRELLALPVGLCLLVAIFTRNYLAIGLALVLALDLIPAEFSHIMPIETLRRLVPHLYYFQILIFTFFILSILLMVELCKKNQIILGFIFLGLMIASPKLSVKLTPNYSEKIFNIKQIDYSKTNFEHLNSPSAAVLIQHQHNLPKANSKRNKKFRSIKAYKPNIVSNYNPEELSLLYDRDLTTFWSSKLAHQNQNEKILIKFPKPHTLKAIRLQAGKKFSDFPRGLRVSIEEACSDELPKQSLKNVIASANPWPGSPQYTKKGFPYYTHESHIQISFPALAVSCILLEQTGSDMHYEWAIAEVEVVSKRKTN